MGILEQSVFPAIIIFLVVDFILRQSLTRFEANAKMRIDSLSGNLRPSLRQIAVLLKNGYTREGFEKIFLLIEGIKPLPSKDMMDLADKINKESDVQSINSDLQKLEKILKRAVDSEKDFSSRYAFSFARMNYPYGFSLLISIILFSVPLLWLPALVLYLKDQVSGNLFWILFIVALIFEIYVWKKRRPFNL